MRACLAVGLLVAATGCSYVKSIHRQVAYAWAAAKDPQQRTYKHMLDRDTFFVYGELLDVPDRDRASMAVVAISDAFRSGEVVDVNHCSRQDSVYALNLPAGEYRLLVVRDANGDGFYDEREVIGGRTLSLAIETAPERVVGGYDIDLRAPMADEVPALWVKSHPPEALVESLFFPRGTIRSLDDDVFSPEMSSLGMYEPAAFLERAPSMFYALEESYPQKVPVVFVHGISGSAREFADLVARLDRRRYQPWFFHYPSGSSLGQLSAMFYRIFLSGKVIQRQASPLVIVAHSMGGLVVRDALNRCTGGEQENTVARLVTVASPMGGYPAAAGADWAPVVLPSWRDLNPSSPFIRELHRKPLPAGLEYHLLYTFGNPSAVKFGENSDGVVPLSAQLPPVAQAEARAQFGLDATHTGVLHDPLAVAHIVKLIEAVKSPYPEDHLREMDRGGYPIPVGNGYTPLEAFEIHAYGHYLDALATGRIAPADERGERLVAVLRGRAKPETPAETAWLKFVEEYPDRSALDAAPVEKKGPIPGLPGAP